MLALHSGEYQEAYLVHKELEEHPNFTRFGIYFKELWVLYHAYLYFLVKVGEIKPLKNDRRFDNFRMGRFLNEIPALATDKRGMNVPTLIVQMLLLLIEKNYDAVLERIEAIDKYRGRYVKTDENFRSDCFIKMVQLLPKGHFKSKKVEQMGRQYLLDLKEVPINFSNQSHETEVLPFPLIWRSMVSNLK